jgi:hypothetical protein
MPFYNKKQKRARILYMRNLAHYIYEKNIPGKAIIIIILSIMSIDQMSSQKICLKNNILYDMALMPNLDCEVSISKKISLDMDVVYNPFQISDTKKWKMLMFQPEVRYWTGVKYASSFFGIHAGYKIYNIGGIDIDNPVFGNLSDYRDQGNLWDAGITYGHQWILSARWGIEAFIGAGYAKLNYDKYKCVKCGEMTGSYATDYFGPTKAGISLVYMIK